MRLSLYVMCICLFVWLCLCVWSVVCGLCRGYYEIYALITCHAFINHSHLLLSSDKQT